MKNYEHLDLLLARAKSRRAQSGNATRPKAAKSDRGEISASRESIKAAEELALAGFASGLKLAAAFGTVAAKTTSLALASIATGADKFSELIRQETMKSQKSDSHNGERAPRRKSDRRLRRGTRKTVLAA